MKTFTQLEKLQYIVSGFQIALKNNTTKNANRSDHCNIRDIKLFLNSQSYPYGNLRLDISHNEYALLRDMFANFQTSQYGKDLEPLLSKANFL